MRVKDLKRCVSLLLCITMFLSSFLAFAEDQLSLPSRTKVIGEEAFVGAGAKNVVLPNGTERIEARAFADSAVNTITVPDSVSFIAPDAFNGCEEVTIFTSAESYARTWCEENMYAHHIIARDENGMILCMHEDNVAVRDGVLVSFAPSAEHVDLPEGIYAISTGAFKESSAKSITFPSTLTTVEDAAFAHGTLQSVEIPDTVTSCGQRLFWLNGSVEHVRLPACVTALAENEFWACSHLVSVELPDHLVSIGKSAFFQCYDLSDIQIPETVRRIGNLAFAQCNSLRSIRIPSGVERIEQTSFGECTSLTSIELPETLQYIGNYAFYGCSALETLTIPASVDTFGEDVFFGCGSLTLRVHRGSAAEAYALENDIPFVVIEVEENPWMQAPVLNTVEALSQGGVHLAWSGNGIADTYVVYELMPEGYESRRTTVRATEAILFGVGAGQHTYVVRSAMAIHNRLSIGEASNAKTIELDPAVWPVAPVWTYADETAPNVFTLRWSGTADLFTVIEFDGNNTESIVASTTANEVQLTDVDSGLHRYALRAVFDDGRMAQSSIRGIMAFGPATRVEMMDTEMTLYIGQSSQLSAAVFPFGTLDNECAWESSDETIATVDENGIVTGMAAGITSIIVTTGSGVSASCMVTVTTTSITSEDGFVVENGVLVSYHGSDTEVTVPDNLGIWKIGENAFGSAPSRNDIVSITLPEGLSVIGEHAFSAKASLGALEEIILPETVVEIGDSAFYTSPASTYSSYTGPISLRSIGPMDSVRKIGNYAFYNCKSLESMSLQSVQSIGYYAFSNCSGLVSVSMPNVQTIDPTAFSDCTLLQYVELPKYMSDNDSVSFRRCTSLKSFRVPEGITQISRYAFRGCTGLESVVLPDSVSEIDSGAFYECSSLSQINLENVEIIWSSAFAYCAFESLELPEGIYLGNGAFAWCARLKEVIIPTDYMVEDSPFLVGVFASSESQHMRMIFREGCKRVELFLFTNCRGLEKVLIPGSVESIYILNTEGVSDKLVIYGNAYSKAQEYANEHNCPFVSAEYWDEDIRQPLDTDELPVVTDASGNILMGTGTTLSSEALFGSRVRMSLSSQGGSVVSVSSMARSVTALSAGFAELQAMIDGVAQTRRIHVVGGFDQRSITMAVGETEHVSWTLDSGTSRGEVTIEASDYNEIAQWNDADSTVTALNASYYGSYALRMDLGNGLFSRCKLIIKEHPQHLHVNPEKLLIGAGETETLTVDVPSYEMDRPYTFTADNPAVATMDETGLITAVGPGSTWINVTAYNGVEGCCYVEVLPEDFSKQNLKNYLNHITYTKDWMLTFSRLFDKGSFRNPAGTVVDGVDFINKTQGVIQKAYAGFIGNNGEYTTPLVKDITRKFYLADQIMLSLSPVKEDDPKVTLFQYQKIISSVKELGDFGNDLNQLYVYVMSNKYGVDHAVTWGDFEDYYEEISDDPIWKEFTEIGTGFSAIRSVFKAVQKIVVYSAVDEDKLQNYISILYQSGDEELQEVAFLLNELASVDGPAIVLAHYGVKPVVEKAASKLEGKIKKASVKAISKALPFVGSVVLMVDVGVGAAKIINNSLFDIDEMQRKTFQAGFTIEAADQFRDYFEDAYYRFMEDPLDKQVFLDFIDCYKVFGDLVAREYETVHEINPEILPLVYTEDPIIGPDGTELVRQWEASWEKWADMSRTMMDESLRLYGEDILDMKNNLEEIATLYRHLGIK